MEVSGKLHNAAPLCLGEQPLLPTEQQVGGSQSQSECFGEQKNLLPLPGIEPSSYHDFSKYVSTVTQLGLMGSNEYSILVFCFMYHEDLVSHS
jgi:hypothetical protein